jgi:hypothetical protein
MGRLLLERLEFGRQPRRCSAAAPAPDGLPMFYKPHGRSVGLLAVATAHDPGLDPRGAGPSWFRRADQAGELVKDRLLGIWRAHHSNYTTQTITPGRPSQTSPSASPLNKDPLLVE